MKQRSSLSIIILILEVAAQNGGASKTKIMRNVMLTYARANRYCSLLFEKKLIEYGPRENVIVATPKGLKVLSHCRELVQLVSPINSLVNKYRFYDVTD
jgi:predicted transcriptional regulator